jgi:cytochrome c-type biogenesis protein CcmE
MSNKAIKFSIGIAVIVAAIAYFAVTGFNEGKAYYLTLDELAAMDAAANDGARLRVAGVVLPGSIERQGTRVTFQLAQGDLRLPVRYVGSAPVPDTFKGGADAIVEGKRLTDGSFEADHIQAKCASKYEAKYGEAAAHPKSVERSY